MIRYLKLFCVALIPFLVYACKTPQFTLTNPPDNYAVFTEGGGFSAAYDSWAITPDGRVYKLVKTADTAQYIGAIDKQLARNLFTNLQKIQENVPPVDKPGNLYRSIEYVDKKGKTEWVFSAFDPEKSKLTILFKNFKGFVNNNIVK